MTVRPYPPEPICVIRLKLTGECRDTSYVFYTERHVDYSWAGYGPIRDPNLAQFLCSRFTIHIHRNCSNFRVICGCRRVVSIGVGVTRLSYFCCCVPFCIHVNLSSLLSLLAKLKIIDKALQWYLARGGRRGRKH